ncbi:MAG: DNA-binding protein HU [Parcubacteria group bacterium RIFCSPHIGHO2_01_FULL_47_10b]|nr:MAG: DNA-binding protein HU [Parcubacteria group bacterium RIFCSPHIGHO2_01_FULL_47_10b]
MNKTELIEAVAGAADVSKAKAKAVLDAAFDAISSSLAKGREVTLTGFGTFKVSQRAARTGRNPQTGATIQIPAMRVPRFKAGKALKDAVR